VSAGLICLAGDAAQHPLQCRLQSIHWNFLTTKLDGAMMVAGAIRTAGEALTAGVAKTAGKDLRIAGEALTAGVAKVVGKARAMRAGRERKEKEKAGMAKIAR